MTIGRLLRLAELYGVEPGELLERPPPADHTVIRRGEHTLIHSPDERLDVYLLAPEGRHHVIPTLTTYEPGGGTKDAFSYRGELFLYVLEGEVSITFEKGGRLTLQAGDTAVVDPSSPHSFANTGTGGARLLSCAAVDDWEHAHAELTRVTRSATDR
jgi:quercetin dioxygenase-like cupin family protein